MIRFAGVDFGAKLAGTTAITWNSGNEIITRLCPKGIDADNWLEDQIAEIGVSLICIDAPLSLPAAYFGNGSDFSYREADRQLKAMSPMFLEGLTSRAMKFASSAAARQLDVLEVYPAALVRHLPELHANYQKKERETIQPFLTVLQSLLPCQVNSKPTTYHEIDSILCWFSGYRYQLGLALPNGNPDEGIIWI